MTRMKSVLFVLVAVAVACAAAPAVASVSDSLTVLRGDGSLFAFTSVTEAEELLLPDPVHFIDDGTADQTLARLPTFVYESTTSTVISDVFGVAVPQVGANTPFRVLAFISDTGEQGVDPSIIEAIFGPTGGVHLSVFEDPAASVNVFDATHYLNPTLRAAGYTATFQSDGDIPEPVSLVVWSVLGAMGGLGFWRKRNIA